MSKLKKPKFTNLQQYNKSKYNKYILNPKHLITSPSTYDDLKFWLKVYKEKRQKNTHNKFETQWIDFIKYGHINVNQMLIKEQSKMKWLFNPKGNTKKGLLCLVNDSGHYDAQRTQTGSFKLQHWCILISSMDGLTFYDSYGLSISEKVLMLVNNIAPGTNINFVEGQNYQWQHKESETCGYWCMCVFVGMLDDTSNRHFFRHQCTPMMNNHEYLVDNQVLLQNDMVCVQQYANAFNNVGNKGVSNVIRKGVIKYHMKKGSRLPKKNILLPF